MNRQYFTYLSPFWEQPCSRVFRMVSDLDLVYRRAQKWCCQCEKQTTRTRELPTETGMVASIALKDESWTSERTEQCEEEHDQEPRGKSDGSPEILSEDERKFHKVNHQCQWRVRTHPSISRLCHPHSEAPSALHWQMSYEPRERVFHVPRGLPGLELCVSSGPTLVFMSSPSQLVSLEAPCFAVFRQAFWCCHQVVLWDCPSCGQVPSSQSSLSLRPNVWRASWCSSVCEKSPTVPPAKWPPSGPPLPPFLHHSHYFLSSFLIILHRLSPFLFGALHHPL